MSGFGARAAVYDNVAHVQRLVAERLAAKLTGTPGRILEIGCGTGFLSAHLAAQFPQAELRLTDLAPEMLAQARQRLGDRALYRVMNGEHPDADLGAFDLIASSLAFQWFEDLPGALARLAAMLNPGGMLVFATLGAESFAAWRRAHDDLGLACGLRDYVAAQNFPWPPGCSGRLGAEMVEERHASGQDFLRGLKRLGAAASPATHRPVPPGRMRALLGRFTGGFTARYEILYGELTAL